MATVKKTEIYIVVYKTTSKQKHVSTKAHLDLKSARTHAKELMEDKRVIKAYPYRVITTEPK